MNTIFIHPNLLYNLNLTLGQAKFYINYKLLPDDCIHKNPFLYPVSVSKSPFIEAASKSPGNNPEVLHAIPYILR